ncbi:assembly factor cbp4 [Rhizopus azygosporus]|uniref:Assembly factor cbp4 n=1 Tax=Rhizopus azygosporus TaxID=86630 RepID=A0A367J1B0_RHIAZ|nr:assembly factor cbp4 [Rhizopus azygosporus]
MANEFKVLVYMTAILGTGYGLMKYTVPDEEQIKKRLDPALRREYDKIKATNREKGQQMMDLMREAAESDKPAWEIANQRK